jgi:hypothetical protein
MPDEQPDILTTLYRSCEPNEPATDEQYVESALVRGDYALTETYRAELRRANEFLCFLFTGHIGGGKSSELVQLKRCLEQKTPEAGHRRYLPIYMDALEYVDEFDVSLPEILLAIATETADCLRTVEDIQLKDNYFLKRWKEVQGYLLSDVEINEGEIPLGQGKVKVQRLRTAPTSREKVRAALLPRLPSLLSEVNSVFEEARKRLKNYKPREGGEPYADIVLIVDNLEKIQRIANKEQGAPSMRSLFLEGAPQLSGLDAHVIYTVPLSFERACGPLLNQTYGRETFVMPMIKVEERGRQHLPYGNGYAVMRQILQRRVGSTPLLEVFTEDALNWIIRYSGGSVRELVKFARESSVQARNTPIDLNAAKRALRRTIALYASSIPGPHWPKMARLELDPNQYMDNDDPDYREMLESITVLEYIDGGDETNLFEKNAPWYGVNPVVRELKPFQDAVAVEAKSASSAGKTP